jgi:hypothetical protein
MNFPNTHFLNQSGRGNALIGQADAILGLELADYWGTVNAFINNGEEDGTGLREPRTKNGAKLISISSTGLLTKSNYQEFQRFQVVDIEMAADAEATLPALIEAVKAAIPNDRRPAIEKRGEALRKAWADGREHAKGAASVAWDASPISTARLSMELWARIKDLDWSLVTSGNVSNWPKRLWAMERYYQWLGGPGGYGVGYGAPAAVGAALANRAEGRFSVSVQSDGDLMYAPGVLWTAARHRIPLLSVMHNNRAYHQEVMHVQRLADRRDRVADLGHDRCPIGTAIENPDPDYAKLAASLGWWSAGPIKDPNELAGGSNTRSRWSRPASRRSSMSGPSCGEDRIMRGAGRPRRRPAPRAGRHSRGLGGERRAGVHAGRLLAVPRHSGPRRRSRPETRPRSAAVRRALELCADNQSPDAGLSQAGSFRHRPRRSLRLSAIDPEGPRPKDDPAAQPAVTTTMQYIPSLMDAMGGRRTQQRKEGSAHARSAVPDLPLAAT